MEQKKTFGAFILRRRRELGMTQREFADRLYVTESAVSKWERGLSYPDITLLRTICSVLQVTEHELLTGSEDTEKRISDQLAAKYRRLTRNYRISQYILYGVTLLGCAIGNLAAQHTLDWFFIALASVMIAGSLTLVPALLALHPVLSHYKAPVALGSFVASLEALLLACCLFTGGDWFFVAAVSVLFGMTLLLLPFLLPKLPLPASVAERKTSAYLILETLLLILLLLTCCIYTGGDWFLIAAVSVLFSLGFLILPVLLRQIPLAGELRRHKMLIYFAVQSVMLIALLMIANLYGGTGLSSFVSNDLPIATMAMLLPWGIMLFVRYLPVNGWFRASLSSAWTALWIWLAPAGLDWVIARNYGEISNPYSPLKLTFNFADWSGAYTAHNTFALIIFSFAAVSVLLFIFGCTKRAANVRRPASGGVSERD